MAEIVNLRQARKQAARRKSETAADANRLAFGLPKGVRQIAKREADRAANVLDGQRLGKTGDVARGTVDAGDGQT